MKRRLRLRLVAAVAIFPALAVAASGCLGYPADGLIATPTAPSEGAASRLPQLLSQLQGGSAGLELFDGTTNEVLGEQDGSVTPSVTAGTGSTATHTPTPTGQKEPGASQTPLPAATYPATVVVYPTSLPLDPGTTPTATPTPDPTAPPATVEPTATPTATETTAPTELPPTPTPTSTIPTEGGPPTE